jgi:hypothetical protein
MPKRKRMRTSRLPNSAAASWFVCGLFGVGEKDLNAAMNRLRTTDVNPGKNLPAAIWREQIRRAKQGRGRWKKLVEPLCHRALADRIRWLNGRPLWSFTASLTERLVFLLLRIYAGIRPELKTRGVPKDETLSLLIGEVFVPTVFNVLVREWRRGLGGEFEGEHCWYLPRKADGKRGSPVARVLDCWLRASGYRTAYGISTKMPARWRRNVERWVKGGPVDDIGELHMLVDEFARDVRWLEKPEEWKARFPLAWAMQNVCEVMDRYFENLHRDGSRMLTIGIRKLGREAIVTDDENGVLGEEHAFFAARLLQLRIRREEAWDRVIRHNLPSGSAVFGEKAKEADIGDYRREIEWRSRQGNWVMEWINKEIRKEQRVGGMRVDRLTIGEQVFDLGVRELNRLLEERRAGGRTRRL